MCACTAFTLRGNALGKIGATVLLVCVLAHLSFVLQHYRFGFVSVGIEEKKKRAHNREKAHGRR